MSVQIVTGYTGERHITPYMDATINRGIFGEDGCILSSGSQMSASMPDINTFVIADGAFSIQGHIGITNGETLTVDTCASGSRRIDLVVARFTHNVDTDFDNMEIVLLKGTETTSQYPTTPTYRTGSIADGANVDLPLYQINLNGSTVTFTRVANLDKNFDVLNTLSNIMSKGVLTASKTVQATKDTYLTGASVTLLPQTKYLLLANTGGSSGAEMIMLCNITISGATVREIGREARTTTSAGQGVSTWKYVETGSYAVTATVNHYGYSSTSHTETTYLVAIPLTLF